MTGNLRETIMRLLVPAGNHCQQLMDEQMRGLQFQYLQIDEIWCYVGKKQKQVIPGDPSEFGDAYTFVAIDQDSKLVPAFLVGKRDEGHTSEFITDLASRVDGFVQITTDGWPCYPGAIMDSFDGRSAYSQIVKTYGGVTTDAAHRYSLRDCPRLGALECGGCPD